MATSVTDGSLQIGGQDRPFRLGQAQEIALRQLHHRRGTDGLPLTATAYRKTFGAGLPDPATADPADVRDFVHAALVAGYQQAGLRVDFNHAMVGQWLAATPDVAQVLGPLSPPAPEVAPARRPAKKTAAK